MLIDQLFVFDLGAVSTPLLDHKQKVNQALMELGATYCSPSGSGVEDQDPLKQFYVSTRLGSAIGQLMKCNSLHSMQSSIGTRASCRLCDPDGVSFVFYDIIDRIGELPTTSTPNGDKISGHAAIPIAPPKKSKREEVLAVAVVCVKDTKTDNNYWLMVKRPPEGLLAGQWEFPSVCLWDSSKMECKKDKGVKASSSKAREVKVPHIDAATRSTELDSYLHDIFQSAAKSTSKLVSCSAKRVQMQEPVVHIFSHVCHTMFVEKCQMTGSKIHDHDRWKTEDGREVGWFSEKDMDDYGITSGVRKVLAFAKA